MRATSCLGLLLVASAAAAGFENEYALYDFQGSPGGEWTLMGLSDFAKHKDDILFLDIIGDFGFSSHSNSTRRFLCGHQCIILMVFSICNNDDGFIFSIFDFFFFISKRIHRKLNGISNCRTLSWHHICRQCGQKQFSSRIICSYRQLHKCFSSKNHKAYPVPLQPIYELGYGLFGYTT